MAWLRVSLLLLCLPLLAVACRDGGLEVPEQGDLGPDLARGDGGDPCAAHGDRNGCEADGRCEASACPTCDGGDGFVGCFRKGSAPPLACPPIACPEGCGFYGTQESCDDDPACTALFDDPGLCDCAEPGCCMMFSRCIENPPQCSPSSVGPQCGQLPWDCGKAYAPVFAGGCQIGCVRKDLCVDEP